MIPREIEEILKRLEPETRKAFEQAFEDIRSSVKIKMIREAIVSNDLQAVFRILQIDERYFRLFDRALAEAFYAGGVVAMANPSLVSAPFRERLSGSTPEIRVRKSGQEPT